LPDIYWCLPILHFKIKIRKHAASSIINKHTKTAWHRTHLIYKYLCDLKDRPPGKLYTFLLLKTAYVKKVSFDWWNILTRSYNANTRSISSVVSLLAFCQWNKKTTLHWFIVLLNTYVHVAPLYIVGSNVTIRVITKLPNSEQSYKGKVKTHNYINRQNGDCRHVLYE
jgi:hypothetical protein